MASDWTLKKIDEFAEVKGGKRLPKGKRLSDKKSNHPYIRVVDFSDGRISLSNLLYVPEDVFPSIERYIVDSGDVVISIVGTIGLVATVPSELHKANLTENAAKILIGDTKIDTQFLSWYLKSSIGQHEIQRNTVGSTQPKLPLYGIKNIEVRFPPLPEQRATAHILGSLDDKIELNRRMNQTLEATARAIFKSWFVDFDPVRAKAEGRPTGLPDDIAALFPDSFEDSELGEIPTGWRVLPLSEVVNIIGGGTPKTKVKEYWGGDIPWFSVVDAPTETDVFVIDTEKHITELGVEKSSTKVLRKGTTIISARGTVGKCALVGRPMAMNQSCYGIQGKNGESDYFVYFTIRRQVSDLQRSGHGSVFNTITRDTFKTIRIACPPTNITTSYEEIVHPLMELVLANLHENATLTSLRDTLLPKLISGELRVPDAEKFIEEAGV
jgi:restriction endonuclease S subunit